MEAYEFISALEKVYVDEDTKEINGVEVSVSKNADRHSKDVVMTLTCYIDGKYSTFERRGTKEISYEQWVDTWWGDWEETE